MSDTQFSSLSPNSSDDIDIENRYREDDLYDQETLSITSNNSVANIDDFDDYKIKADPFLSDFMKDDIEDSSRLSWLDVYTEANDENLLFSPLNSENDLDQYLSSGTDCLDAVTPELLDWDSVTPINPLSVQKQILHSHTNKRPHSPTENLSFNEISLPIKQRRVEVSLHERCDEWINKYHETPERASCILDRRKTKHHKVLRECDADFQVDMKDLNRYRAPLEVVKRPTGTQNSQYVKLHPHKANAPMTIYTYSSKHPTIHTASGNQNVVRKQPTNCNYTNNPVSHIIHHSKDESPTKNLSNTQSPSNGVPEDCSKVIPEAVEMPRIPPPLRMGKRISRRGHRFSLWQFLMCLLDSSKYREHSTGIKWMNRNNGVFNILDSKQVATLWGQYKERRDKMTYDSLARSLRHYYKKNLMAKINNRRLVYQIAQECILWSSETFLKRNKE